MTVAKNKEGYTLTEQDIGNIKRQLARTMDINGVNITATTGYANGLAGVAVGIEDASLGFNAKVLTIQSWKESGRPAQFAVLSEPDGAPFGPELLYDSLVEALIYTDIHLSRTVESLRERKNKPSPPERKAVPAFADNVISSAVLSPEEVHFTQTYVNELGKACRLRGYANFVEAKIGVMSVAIGVVHEGQTMILGTVVVASNLPGNTCSVRDFQNKPMPGAEYYDSIYAALISTRPYFNKLAELAAKQMRPSLMSRLFGR